MGGVWQNYSMILTRSFESESIHVQVFRGVWEYPLLTLTHRVAFTSDGAENEILGLDVDLFQITYNDGIKHDFELFYFCS